MAVTATVADPKADPRLDKIKWTVYRGKAYDITDFVDRHPGGQWLINLAVGRDCTGELTCPHQAAVAPAEVVSPWSV